MNDLLNNPTLKFVIQAVGPIGAVLIGCGLLLTAIVVASMSGSLRRLINKTETAIIYTIDAVFLFLGWIFMILLGACLPFVPGYIVAEQLSTQWKLNAADAFDLRLGIFALCVVLSTFTLLFMPRLFHGLMSAVAQGAGSFSSR